MSLAGRLVVLIGGVAFFALALSVAMRATSARPLFKWFDFWVGLFWDSKGRKLYVFPVPMFGIVFEFGHATTAAQLETLASLVDATRAVGKGRYPLVTPKASEPEPARISEPCDLRYSHTHRLDTGREYFCSGSKDK